MRTHELAKILGDFAKLLKKHPDIDLSDWAPQPAAARTINADDAGLSLAGMIALSQLGKPQWRKIIEEWKLPIDIPSTYSARDTIGKLMNYLSENPQVMERFTKERAAKSTNASPELMQALSVLLRTGRQ